MSIKSFNPNAASAQKWITAAGNYEVTVRGFEAKYTKNADYYAKFTFVTAEGEATTGIIYAKPDRNGNHIGLESFMAATATDAEVQEYVSAGEITVDLSAKTATATGPAAPEKLLKALDEVGFPATVIA